MKKSLIFSALLLSTLYGNQHSTHWGYTGHEAPQYWGELDEKFKMCGIGQSQSPINITPAITVKTQDLNPIKFNYHAHSLNVANNGHAIQVNVDSHSSINIDGQHFTLKQFHFHSPSENEIDGRSFPLEAHFVHVSKDGKIAVIAVLFELGNKNETIQKIFDSMPLEASKEVNLELSSEMIDKLLPKEKEYYYFNGSLTTPPCSEGVKWMVIKEYQTISKDQLKQFTNVIEGNNRPTQPINARKVIK